MKGKATRMTRSREDILHDLSLAVLDMENERALELADEALAAGIEAFDIIQEGLVPVPLTLDVDHVARSGPRDPVGVERR